MADSTDVDETIVFDDEDDNSHGSPVWDEIHNILRVMEEKCSTCIFGPNSVVRGKTVRILESNTRQEDGNHIQCHHTLPMVTGRHDVGAICRGWWDRNHRNSIIFRLAIREGVVQYTPEPPVHRGIQLKRPEE